MYSNSVTLGELLIVALVAGLWIYQVIIHRNNRRREITKEVGKIVPAADRQAAKARDHQFNLGNRIFNALAPVCSKKSLTIERNPNNSGRYVIEVPSRDLSIDIDAARSLPQQIRVGYYGGSSKSSGPATDEFADHILRELIYNIDPAAANQQEAQQ